MLGIVLAPAGAIRKTRPVPWRSRSRRRRETDNKMTILINVSLKTEPGVLTPRNAALWRHLTEETDTDGGAGKASPGKDHLS